VEELQRITRHLQILCQVLEYAHRQALSVLRMLLEELGALCAMLLTCLQELLEQILRVAKRFQLCVLHLEVLGQLLFLVFRCAHVAQAADLQHLELARAVGNEFDQRVHVVRALHNRRAPMAQ
jgi:hypothetical protein